MSSNAEYTLEEVKKLITAYIEHRSQGYSKTSFVDCDYRTIERHLEVYESDLQPEKRELERAERVGQKMWEQIGKTIAVAGQGNATAWIFNMKNRYPQEWNDKQTIQHEGNAESPVIFKLDERFNKGD